MTDVSLSEIFEAQAEFRYFRRDLAEGKLPLVVVTGSGLSAPAHLPSWAGLRANLQTECDNRVRAFAQMGEAFLGSKVEAARKQKDPWVAFKLFKEILGNPLFEGKIVEELTPSDNHPDAPGYEQLLKLRPKGLVTLNLDKLAGDALVEAYPGQQVTPVYGKEISRKWYNIQSSKIYLLHLHGTLDDPSTWVLTQDDLNELFQSEGHAHYLRTLYTEHIVLFAGMSADDIALSRRLLELTADGVRPQNIYWLTPRLDADTDAWASDAYIKLIRYPCQRRSDHGVALDLLVDICVSYRLEDTHQPPLVDSSAERAAPDVESLEPEDLAQHDPEIIRLVLAARLNSLLKESSEEDREKIYRNFCISYDYALNRAFYKGKSDKFSQWFGYRLQFPNIGRGNFGEVFSAINAEGDLVAVKIMHQNIFENDDMLGGFRRGVRSMKFITSEKIEGMVPIIESFELPPTIVMPFVTGVSVDEAIKSAGNMEWETRLDIVIRAGHIIKSGHALPQTVMHRDVKPSNIMITNLEYDGTAFEPDIVVLDFDMSWHKGAKEKDVIFETRDDFGYLAPEQTRSGMRYGSRNTKVDSYGLGMTIFYVFGGEHPVPNEGLSPEWFSKAEKAARRGYGMDWLSAPTKLARIIVSATEFEQPNRMDFVSVVRQLEIIKNAIADEKTLTDPGAWAEEVIANAGLQFAYSWDEGNQSGKVLTPGGISVITVGNIREASVDLEIGYMDRGMRDRGSLVKYLGPAIMNAEKILTQGGWKLLEKSNSTGNATLRVRVPTATLRADKGAILAVVGKAIDEFNFQ